MTDRSGSEPHRPVPRSVPAEPPETSLLRHEAAAFSADRLHATVRRSWVLLMALPIVGFAVGYLWAASQPEVWEAEYGLLIGPPAPLSPLGDFTTEDPTRRLATEAALLDSDWMRDLVSREVGGSLDYDVKIEDDADVLTVTATASSAAAAQTGAEQVVAIFQRERERQFDRTRADTLSSLRRTEETLERELAALESAPAGDELVEANRAELLRALAETQSERAVVEAQPNSGFRSEPLAPEDPPDSPTWPQPLLSGALAGLGGLGLAFGVAHLLGRRNAAPSDRAGLSQRQLMATPQIETPTSFRAAAIDQLARSVTHELATRNQSALLVAGSTGATSSSIVATAVAEALARSGLRTVLVAADPADTTIDRSYGLTFAPGLGDATATTPLRDILHYRFDRGSLAVLPRGRQRKSAEALGATLIPRLLPQLELMADVIVISCPAITGPGSASWIPFVPGVGLLVDEHPGASLPERLARAQANQQWFLVLSDAEVTPRPLGPVVEIGANQ